MRIIIYIVTFFLSIPFIYCQINLDERKSDTIVYSSKKCEDCKIIYEEIIYKPLKCGLYEGSNGDIGYRSKEIYNDRFDSRTRFITCVYGADRKDTINGGLKKMKYLIDISSFRFLNFTYWADKNNIYIFIPTSDGGTVSINELIDRKSFELFEGTDYAKDKSTIYYRGSKLDDVDFKTFRIINNKEISSLAVDKNSIFQFGEKLTEDEIKEWKLESYRK